MRIIHRVTINSSREIQAELAGLDVDVAEFGLVTFEVDENHRAWRALSGWIADHQAVDIVSTTFSEREMADAHWLELGPSWHHGYPQPDEGRFGYLRATYDLSMWCRECGIGKKQNAPFQMKREPNWGNYGILQLNWVFDEFFVTPAVWAQVFKPWGIGCRPVMDTKGVELGTVRQLVVEEEVGIVSEGLPSERCAVCGQAKFLPVTRGPFPALVEEPTQGIARTRESFGSGRRADKRVIVSRALALAMAAERVRGASTRPVASQAKASRS